MTATAFNTVFGHNHQHVAFDPETRVIVGYDMDVDMGERFYVFPFTPRNKEWVATELNAAYERDIQAVCWGNPQVSDSTVSYFHYLMPSRLKAYSIAFYNGKVVGGVAHDVPYEDAKNGTWATECIHATQTLHWKV